jgi:hypothetical protein
MLKRLSPMFADLGDSRFKYNSKSKKLRWELKVNHFFWFHFSDPVNSFLQFTFLYFQ